MKRAIIVGVTALDKIETPFGSVQNVLGGSATYAALASSIFSKTGIVAPAGEDLPEEHLELFSERGIDISGLERSGKAFRWEGFYEFDMNEAKTLRTELNNLSTFQANLPEDYKNAEYVFLGNIDPKLQLKVISQLRMPKFIAMDTMNFWIEHQKSDVLEAIKKVQLVVLNDGETRMLFETVNLTKAAKECLTLGPEAVIIKKGEHGALLYTKDKHFSAPGYPLEVIKDPTGCGDSFGGALIGYLASSNDSSDTAIRRAIVYGSAVASFTAEDFGTSRLRTLTREEVEKRFREFREMREF
ncbi:sugar kinase [Candidatus Woesearchaeota archaeon]|nr:sugar kinase [Candidatus Woesearchaeota archaeon]